MDLDKISVYENMKQVCFVFFNMIIGISDDTNLPVLNARIWDTETGESGRGFSVAALQTHNKNIIDIK